jgi:hypothetical protein
MSIFVYAENRIKSYNKKTEVRNNYLSDSALNLIENKIHF